MATWEDTPMSNTTPAPTIADRTRSLITDYVSFPADCFADMFALYTIHTHTFIIERDDEGGPAVLSKSAPRTTPYIYITSQGPGSGKTRVLEVLHELVGSPELVANLTGPTMFRMIEAIRPTIFLDEVDTIYSGAKNEELRGVLNSGYKHNGTVARVDEKSELGFRRYSTFCPKVLAGIDNGNVPNTVLDRSITVTLVKAAPGSVKPFYSEDVEDLAEDLKDDIRTWVAANMDKLADRSRRPEPIDGLSDRQNDIIRPLLAIADLLPGWGKRARMALVACFAESATPLTPQAEALSRVRAYVLAHGLTRVSSAKVVELVGQSAHQVGAWFDAFGIQPKTIRFSAADRAGLTDGQADKVKGYMIDATMTEAWDRFLPAIAETITES